MSTIPDVLKPEYFFDLDLMDYRELFDNVSCVWEVVKKMQEGTPVDKLTRARCEPVTDSVGSRQADSGENAPDISGSVETRIAKGARVGPYVVISGDGGLVCIDEGAEIRPGTMIIIGKNAVYIGRGAKVGPNAHLDASKGSICVGEKAVLRQGSFLRELSLIGTKTVIGNSCEIKCALVGREAEVPHFNYVGDSIFGYKAHTGAGVKISNLKITPDPKKVNTVKVRYEGQVYDTGMRKFGAILGDRVQVGCNSVLNPGTFVGKNTLVYTGSNIVGFIPENTVVKLRQTFERAELRL